MKTLFRISICLLSLIFIMAFTSIKRTLAYPILKIEPKPVKLVEVKIDKKEILIDIKGHNAFLEAIGQKESGNNYKIVNTYGYMGRYQFGKATLKGLGFKVTKEEFLNNPQLQEEAMKALLKHNKKKLKRFIEKYEGEIIHGILITESGVLAAAHLAGAGNVKKFFKSGNEFKDGYGTRLTTYLEQFGGYKINI